MAADINKIKNIPSFSSEKTDMLIGLSVVGLAKSTLWIRAPQDGTVREDVRGNRPVLRGPDPKGALS